MIQIEIIDEPKQKFSLILNSRRVTFELWYSVFNDRWSLDLSIDGDKVLHGRKIVTGIDLLEAFDFGIGVIFAWSNGNQAPTRENLPLGLVRLYHTTREEIDAAVAT